MVNLLVIMRSARAVSFGGSPSNNQGESRNVSSFRRRATLRRRLILVPLAAVVLAGALVMAQSPKSEPKWRTVKGTVVDKKGNPAASALVRLKDLRAHGQGG